MMIYKVHWKNMIIKTFKEVIVIQCKVAYGFSICIK